ncbi:MAG: J domain-containing protein, partial [Acetatifactor sp.]|nr:J domain-containing protein [Acetatifactor sp.]
MEMTECFLVLGIEPTKDERMIKNAYREKLAVTNPEDDPEGFKRLRAAYEEASVYAKRSDEEEEAQAEQDTTPSGLWVERVTEIYTSIRSRQNLELWKALFDDDIFM